MYESPFFASQGRGAFADNNTRSSLPALADGKREVFREPLSDNKAIALLAYWLANSQNSPEETARLGGKLLFPHKERGAELFMQSSLATLDLKESAELKALALFSGNDPHSIRGAFLAIHYFTDKTVLTLAERREFAASLSFPHSEKGADECERWLTQVTKGLESSPAKLQRGVCELVRGVTRMSLSFPVSLGHLSYLLDLDPEVLRQAILDPVSGLKAPELKAWERHSGISTTLLKDPLMLRVGDALRRILTLDAFLYSVGITDNVLPGERLTQLYPNLTQDSPLWSCAPRSEDKHLRDYLLHEKQDGGMYEVRHSLIYSTLHEIELHRKGELSRLRNDQELARLEGISSVTVERLLEEGLSESAFRYRQSILQKECVLHCDTIAGYRRAELEALQKGEITSVRREVELADRFGVSLQEIRESTTQALSREELLLLDVAMRVGERATPAEQAATLLLQHKLFEQLFTHHIVALGKEVGETTGAKVAFRRCDFDSFEEAALAILLTTYLRGYELQPGVTFQVPNNGKFHDFVIDGVFGGELQKIVLEYHRPRAYYSPSKGGDFESYEEYQEYRRFREGFSSSEEKEQFENQILAYLGNEYHQKRRALLDSHPRLKGYTLVTVIDPTETYYELKRLNVPLPEKGIFLSQFNSLVKRLKTAYK